MFCSKCGALIVPGKDKNICPVCGHEEKKVKKEDGKIITKSTEKDVIVINESSHVEPLDSDATCPKCGHRGAYFVLKQTRSADEPETAMYTCEKCGHRWREY